MSVDFVTNKPEWNCNHVKWLYS